MDVRACAARRYCSPHCLQEHWNTGHKKKCKKIQRAGGAEQFYANAKFKEAADAAVAACAAEGVPQDTECFICRFSIEGKGIVRGCGCRGTMGLAHVACLVRQAEAEVKRFEEWHDGEAFDKWERCFDCGQSFHGALELALGWACWKTYLGRPERDKSRRSAMGVLGDALRSSRPEEAIPVIEAHLALRQRYWSDSGQNAKYIFRLQGTLIDCLHLLGRLDEALDLSREIYSRRVGANGASHKETIVSGARLALSLSKVSRYGSAIALLRDDLLPAARESLGTEHNYVDGLNHLLAEAFMDNPDHTRDKPRLNAERAAARRHILDVNTGDDLLLAETITQGVVERRRRIDGPTDRVTVENEALLAVVREKLELSHSVT